MKKADGKPTRTPPPLAGADRSAAAWHEALSLVTMGVVHDFNNALTGMLSLSEHLLAQVDEAHAFHEGLALIRDNTAKAAQLAHLLLKVHHDSLGETGLRDANTVIAGLMDLLRRVVPKRVELSFQPEAGPLPLEMDDVEFRRVIVFLALHGAGRIVERGKVQFCTSRHSSGPEATGRKAGLWGCLTVSDSGPPAFDGSTQRWLEQARLFAEKYKGTLSLAPAGASPSVSLWLPLVDLDD